MPYVSSGLTSAAFAEESADEDEDQLNEEIMEEEVVALEDAEIPPSTAPFQLIDLEGGALVCQFPNVSDSLYFSGSYDLIVLSGKIDVDGYQADRCELLPINRPAWTNATQIKPVMPSSNQTVQSAAKFPVKLQPGITKKLKEAISMLTAISSTLPTFLILNKSNQNSLLDILEDRKLYRPTTNRASQGSKLQIQSVTSFHFTNGVIGTHEALRKPFTLTQFPSPWRAATEPLKSIQKSHRVVICGAKGVGKSTFLRFIVNQLLKTYPKVCILETDLGQPELTVPGLISLHVVDQPLLSASHHNVRQQPHAAMFLGDVSSRNEPDRFCKSFQALLQAYNALLSPSSASDSIKAHTTEVVSKAPSLVSKRFGTLANDDDDEDEDRKPKSNPQKSQPSSDFIPLIVNTDGFIKYMGAEILTAIISMTNPDYLFHLYQRHNPELSVLGSVSSIAPTCQVVSLESAVRRVSTISQPEMRHLRMLSYFLGSMPIDELVTVKEQSTLQQSQQQQSQPVLPLNIKNATVNDGGTGYFALKLLEIPPMLIPFDKCLFNMVHEGLPMSSILATINGKLVGVSIDDGRLATEVSLIKVSSKTSQSAAFSLHCFMTFQVTFNYSLAVVRAVDLERQCVVLTLPHGMMLPPLPTGRIVITPMTNLQLPSYMMYAPAMPTLPYYSSEVTGEASGQVKNRPNLKRKQYEQS